MGNVQQFIDLDPLRSVSYTFAELTFAELSVLKTRRHSYDIYDFEEWTPKIQEDVAEYLTNLSDDHFAVLLWELSEDLFSVQLLGLENEILTEAREGQIASIITGSGYKPSEIARAAHYVAVRTVPSLKALIDSLIGRPYDARRDYLDIGEWLDANTTVEQRIAFVHEIDPTYPVVPPEGEAGNLYIVDWLELLLNQRSGPTRYQLLKAWEAVSAPKEAAKSMASPRTKSAVAAIRAWANEKGLKLAKRGRIPTAIIDEYQRELQLD